MYLSYIIGVGLNLPIQVAFALRATKYAHDHPNVIRSSFTVAYYSYFLTNCCLNMGCQILVFIRGIMTGQLHLSQLIMMPISVFIWLYDDIKLLKILKEYSQQHYEVGTLLQLRQMVSVDENVRSVHIDNEELSQHLYV